MTAQLALVAGGEPMTGTAVFSACGRYRYALTRTWDPNARRALFLMLNPSKAGADPKDSDNTITRCIDFAKRWGMGALLVGNLHAWIETDSAKLDQAQDPVGPENDDHLARLLADADLVVCAWGTKGGIRGRDRLWWPKIRSFAPHALRITKDGHPEHPLYMPADTKPQPYWPPWAGTWAAPEAVRAALHVVPPPRALVPSESGGSFVVEGPSFVGRFASQAERDSFLTRVRGEGEP